MASKAKKSRSARSGKKAVAKKTPRPTKAQPRRSAKPPAAPRKKRRTSFKQVVLGQLSSWADQDPDARVVGSAGYGKSLTRHQIHREVEKGSRLGREFLQNLSEAAVRSVLSAKIK
jgi:hypothetical protein